MSVLIQDNDVCVRWSTAERLQALKRIVSKRAIANALKSAGLKETPCRRLPRWFVVWFVVALGLFRTESYQQVFRWLMAYKRKGVPGRSTLCEARKSVGSAPLRILAESLIQLLAQATTPGAFYAGMRLMGVDGTVLDVFDSPANAKAFGRPGGSRSPGAFPQVRTLSLCELGTHVLWKTVIEPLSCGEQSMMWSLLGFLQENMLLLWDRGFFSYALLKAVRERQTHLLARVKSHMVFKPIRRLSDGSFIAKAYRRSDDRDRDRHGILVRIIEYTFDDPHRPGAGVKHRLLTTLLSAKEHPAKTLIELYHQRWEQELAFDEVKTHLHERPVLRSATPDGVIQEVYGLLLAHFVIRQLMFDAAATIGVDPREMSFVGALKILRCRLGECPRSPRGQAEWYARLLEEIADQRLPPRRNRINPRVIKRKMSRWLKKRKKHCEIPQPTKTFRCSIVMCD